MTMMEQIREVISQGDPMNGVNVADLIEATGFGRNQVDKALERLRKANAVIYSKSESGYFRYFTTQAAADAYLPTVMSDEERRAKWAARKKEQRRQEYERAKSRKASEPKVRDDDHGRSANKVKAQRGTLSFKPVPTAFAKASPTNPNNVQVQRVPGFKETRFTPEPGFVGGFMAEWREKRGQA